MGLLEGKKIVITGVLTDASLAYGVAKIALEEGADIVLTGAGRALSLTQRTARKLGDGLDVFELDVTVPEHVESVREAVAAKWGRVDGVLHAIGFAPASCLGDDFFAAPWEDVPTAMHISTYSLKTLADAFVPLMDRWRFVRRPRLRQSAGVAGVQLDGRRQVRAAEPQPLPRPRARRASRSAATSSPPARCARWPPSRSPASPCSRTPGTAGHPLGWDVNDSQPVAKACCALLSDWFPATTGEIIHVDGGYHAVGA